MVKKFTKKSISNQKRSYTKKKYSKKKNFNTKKIFKFLAFIFVSFILFAIIWGVIFYQKYIVPLPPVENLKTMEIAESSTIYDKDGKELYKIFKEKRTYVNYDDISKNMINAIVAWEDQRFWTTPWFDLVWITRSVIVSVVTWTPPKWTSGISQQLMKVTYLSNERKLERKLKELYLSRKLNKVFDKKKILELYLNKIFFWANSYWIEQASHTFFGKKASELNVLESSILASLPKAPSGLSPYNHADKLLGYPYIYEDGKEGEVVKLTSQKELAIYNSLTLKLKSFIENLKFKDVNWRLLICWLNQDNLKKSFRIDSDWCTVIDYDELLWFLNSIKIKDWKNYIEYQTWRKDYILWRMLEDKYITWEEYKKSILEWFWYRFKKYSDKIKYPYFVMYVREYLENKYWKEVVEKWWLKIYTTLDSSLQDKAEELIKKYWDINEKRFWAKNDAIISVDNESGWILTMVWWRDYFDIENGGNNNMITSRLQPGSTFKPFTYALAIKNNRIWNKTPVYDLQTTFPWKYTPANFDGRFMGKMTIETALNNSRNIPAIKMFFLAGWEKVIIDFMDKLWVKTLAKFKQEYRENHWREYVYWASMSLWTWLMTPLELAWAYSVFANWGKKVDINPILKIVDSKWNIIEDNSIKKAKKEQVMSADLAYIMNTILSNTNARPAFWNTYLSLPDRKIAAKTWTSTKQFYKWWVKKIYPRNLWTIWYTPQITTVVWVWNTDWEQLYYNWNGLEWAWPIMRDYMAFAHKNLIVQNWKRTSWVKEVNVSEVSGLLPSPDWFPDNFLTSSLFLNVPNKYDQSLRMVEVDSLCNWKVTEDTPINAIKRWYFLNFHSLKPENPAWENPVQEWVREWKWKEKYWNIWNIITSYSDEPCERHWKSKVLINWSIEDWAKLFVWNNYVEIWFKSERPIKELLISLNSKVIYNLPIWWAKKGLKKINFNIPKEFTNKTVTLKFSAIDSEGYSYDDTQTVTILASDKIAPEILLDWPSSFIISKWDELTITWKVKDNSWIRSINFYIDWNPIKLGLKDRNFSYTIDSSSIEIWKHILKVEAYDDNFNLGSTQVDLIVK